MASREYWPQLDGVRAVAICAVIAYHLGYLPGGWVGVDIFFVLSGYLITTILLGHGGPGGRLAAFWGGRAKRLLPAVLLLLLTLTLYAWIGGPGVVPAQLRTPALSTLFYTANWQEIHAGHSYFAQFNAPTPLLHMWSLAVEEQYYLIWPLLLGVLLIATKSRWIRHPRRALIGGTLMLAVFSATWMGVAAHIYDPNRAYLGTDTRAWELLLGGAVAMLWPPDVATNQPGVATTQPDVATRQPDVAASRRRVWSLLAALGAIGVGAGIWWSGGPPWWVWDGGLVGIALCVGFIIVGSVRSPQGPVSRVLALRPVCWVGLISYSLYLWHWPVIVLMTQDNTGLSGGELLTARLAAMVAAACGSYYLVERPLRRADWRNLRRRLRVPAPSFALAGLGATAVLIVGGTVGPQQAASATVSLSALQRSPLPPGEAPLDVAAASPSHPYRVWILGDSVMQDASLGVQAALQATGEMQVVLNSSFAGWGLTNDPGWTVAARQDIATYHPQIVIGTWSWDDQAASETPGAYLRQLEGAMRGLLTPGDGVEAVVLLQFPQTGPATAVSDVAARNAAYVKQTTVQDDWDAQARQAVGAFPGHALYLTTDELFAPDGRYYTWFKSTTGSWIRARKLDNTHFCPYGAAEFGALITEDLTSQLHLPAMRPGWEFGAWTRSHRYDDPPGACPADQPPPGYDGVQVPKPTDSPLT